MVFMECDLRRCGDHHRSTRRSLAAGRGSARNGQARRNLMGRPVRCRAQWAGYCWFGTVLLGEQEGAPQVQCEAPSVRRARVWGTGTSLRSSPGRGPSANVLSCHLKKRPSREDWALYPRIPDGNVADGHPGLH